MMMFGTKGHFTASVFATGIIGYFMWASQVKARKRRKAKYGILDSDDLYGEYLLLLVACVLSADGKTTDSELRYIESALKEHYKPDKVARKLKFVKSAAAKGSINYKKICDLIRHDFTTHDKVQLLHLLIGIATADGMMMKVENALIKDMALRMRIPFKTYQSILNMFHFRHEGFQEKKKVYSSKLRLSQAYKILELDDGASVAQIKKAYRKLAMKHHPDRLVHLGEAHQKAAKEKFQIISDAYEYIKSKKGFS